MGTWSGGIHGEKREVGWAVRTTGWLVNPQDFSVWVQSYPELQEKPHFSTLVVPSGESPLPFEPSTGTQNSWSPNRGCKPFSVVSSEG